MVREFSSEVAGPRSFELEARSEDPVELYRQLAELGLTGIPFPEEYGGGGQPYLTYLLVIEELARTYLSLAIGLSVHTLCAFAIERFGSDPQKKEILAQLATGEWFGAYSLSEPASGSDAASLTTKATQVDAGYRLTGSKVFCTRGMEADVVLVMARTGQPGPGGISAFLVDHATPGFSGTKKEEKMGWRSSPTWALAFDDAVVPAERLLGAEGQGFKIAPRRSTPDALASPHARSGSRKLPSTRRSRSPASASSSDNRCRPTRASDSCSLTWQRGSKPAEGCTGTRRSCATMATTTPCKQRKPSFSARTWP